MRKRDFAWDEALHYLPGDWNAVRAPAARAAAHTASAAEFALAIVQLVVGSRPATKDTDLVIHPCLPSDWRFVRVANCPDKHGAFDLELRRTEQGLRVHVVRRRGAPLTLVVRAWGQPPAVMEKKVVVSRDKPATITFPTPESSIACEATAHSPSP